MTERRASFVSPVPPPPNPALSYDQAQVAVRKAICRACATIYMVPVRIAAEDFVCSRCTDGQ